LKVLGLSNKIQWKKSGNSIEINLPKERNQLKYATVIQITQ
jgi:alpha-L-fucosidase